MEKKSYKYLLNYFFFVGVGVAYLKEPRAAPVINPALGTKIKNQSNLWW